MDKYFDFIWVTVVAMLKAFGEADGHIEAIRLVLSNAIVAAETQMVESVKAAIENVSKGKYGNGALAAILSLSGVRKPELIASVFETIGLHINANLRVDIRKQWDETANKFKQDFWAVDIYIPTLFGDAYVLRLHIKGVVNSVGGVSIAPAKQKRDKGEYSPSCRQLAQEWLAGKWSREDQNIGLYLPKEKPGTVEEAYPIVEKALSERAKATKNNTTEKKTPGKRSAK